ncbi:organic solute transporter Ostalpha-domain-containing protein [Podospora conica]|nr:organic solute transporter Ostalpha-domain-containing protein [Schizothecium conicum]
MNLHCNTTLEDLRILPTTERIIAGPFTFHDLALIIAGGSAAIAILFSFFLIMMHATHYTVPNEQKHALLTEVASIIRILFMIPVYATSSWLSIRFYWHAIYFQVLSDCYEAFAISSFFSLMCHYIAPDLHDQKDYFREMSPVQPWVWPLSWFRKCCGGERGPWRTPRNGLTWFNIIWIGVYHYCFIRVAMTVTAVVTQYFERYCESSNSPFFAHIWVVAIQSLAVTIAMYCLIQFYVQLRNTEQLAQNQPFLKILAIKLVIFLSFWQSVSISVGTSTLQIIHPNEVIAYPDLKVGIPSLLLCVEMAIFAILHLWAFPYQPYARRADGISQGAFRALFDAIFVWDVIKGFGRGMRWLFVGARHRHEPRPYRDRASAVAMTATGGPVPLHKTRDLHPLGMSHAGTGSAASNSTLHLPIASQFRASAWYDRRRQFRQQLGLSPSNSRDVNIPHESLRSPSRDESAGLILNAQPNALNSPAGPAGLSPAPSPSPYSSGQRLIPGSPLVQQQTNTTVDDGGAKSPYTDGGRPFSVSTMSSTGEERRRPSYVSMMDGEEEVATAAVQGRPVLWDAGAANGGQVQGYYRQQRQSQQQQYPLPSQVRRDQGQGDYQQQQQVWYQNPLPSQMRMERERAGEEGEGQGQGRNLA